MKVYYDILLGWSGVSCLGKLALFGGGVLLRDILEGVYKGEKRCRGRRSLGIGLVRRGRGLDKVGHCEIGQWG